MSILAFLVSFLASTAGAICGIGGGVIIKPTLDLFQMANVSTISFLSGCTVLSMSLYSVGRGLLAHDSTVDFKTGTPLALGAAIGGVFGKQLFTAVKEAASNPNMVGGVQAGCLAIITIYTLAYTVNKAHIKTRQIQGSIPCVTIDVYKRQVYGGGLKAHNAAMLASIEEIDGGLIALTRFSGEIGFYPEEYLEIIRLYLGE